MSRPDSQRLLELDGMRGLAAVAVVLAHLPRGFRFGETGVDLFFVLSGFLITSIIVRNCDKPGFLYNYYVRRSLRIWPIYYLTLVLVVSVNLIRRNPAPMEGFSYYFLYIQHVWDYWGGTPPVFELPLTHTWTLAIEEQFYLVWPLLILLAGPRSVLPISIMLLAASVGLRTCGLSRLTLLGHLDGLALGAVLSWLQPGSARRIGILQERSLYLALCVGSFLAYGMYWGQLSAIGMPDYLIVRQSWCILAISLAYFGLTGLVVSLQGSKWMWALRSPALRYVGQLSYGLYLYHYLVFEYVDTCFKLGLHFADPWWLDLLKIAASFAIAIPSWHLIEQPILKLKDRFEYQRRCASGPAVELRSPEMALEARPQVGELSVS